MGGGLGHLTRSLAILQEAPELIEHVRLMASSKWTALVVPHAPCPVDIVAGEILTSKQKYLHFLQEYLQRHHIELLVLDTFPFGIVGEWLDTGDHLPRILIARDLKWDEYLKRVKTGRGQIPQHALLLEPLAKNYLRVLKKHSQLTSLDAPITLPFWEGRQGYRRSQKEGCLIVHSGDETERKMLRRFTQQEFGASAAIDCIFPEHGFYPAERVISKYKKVVSAAGYNMTALASQAPPDRIHLLHPFTRRFDNQFRRAQQFKAGELWKRQHDNGAQDAAKWLWSII